MTIRCVKDPMLLCAYKTKVKMPKTTPVLRESKQLVEYRDVYFPDTLLEIAGNAVNTLPKPLSWSWSVSDVIGWVKYGLRLPQYAVIFEAHNVDGKKLIFINCQTLPFMNITDFDHIKYIAKNVRRLYGLPPDTVDGHRRRSVHDVYGRYYAQLAAGATAGTLFDYMLSVGTVSRPRRKPSGCPLDRRPSQRDATLLARPRAGRCGLCDTAVARLRAGTRRESRRPAGPDQGRTG